jgi:hypothetical protein
MNIERISRHQLLLFFLLPLGLPHGGQSILVLRHRGHELLLVLQELVEGRFFPCKPILDTSSMKEKKKFRKRTGVFSD